MAKNNTYDADSITVLEGLEAVRKRPGMYIGSVSTKGLNHLIYEIVDNAVGDSCNSGKRWLCDNFGQWPRSPGWYACKRRFSGANCIYDTACRW